MSMGFRDMVAGATVLVLSAANLFTTGVRADTLIDRPDGYTHTYRGDHGETFKTMRDYKSGTSVTLIDKADGKGFVPFVTPPPLKVTKESSASLYDPYTNRTITKILVPRGSSTLTEEGNTLSKH